MHEVRQNLDRKSDLQGETQVEKSIFRLTDARAYEDSAQTQRACQL